MVAAPRVDEASPRRAFAKRRWWTRLSSSHILILMAAALAFVANLAVLRPEADPPLVAVAAADLLPGTVFDPVSPVRWVPMQTDSASTIVVPPLQPEERPTPMSPPRCSPRPMPHRCPASS